MLTIMNYNNNTSKKKNTETTRGKEAKYCCVGLIALLWKITFKNLTDVICIFFCGRVPLVCLFIAKFLFFCDEFLFFYLLCLVYHELLILQIGFCFFSISCECEKFIVKISY